MIDARWRIEIDRPPEQVFDFLADLDNEPSFVPDVSNVVKQTAGPIGIGTVYTEDFKRMGVFTTTIDQFERPSKLGFDARNSKSDVLVRFHLAPSPAGTQVTCELTLTFKGFSKVMEPLMAGKIRKEIESTRGPMLKQALENGS